MICQCLQHLMLSVTVISDAYRGVTDVVFMDTNDVFGTLAGPISWTRPSDLTDVDGYRFLITAAATYDPSTLDFPSFAELDHGGFGGPLPKLNSNFTLADTQRQAIIAMPGATPPRYLQVHTVISGNWQLVSELAPSAIIPLYDIGGSFTTLPFDQQHVTFVDSDPRCGFLGGSISFDLPADADFTYLRSWKVYFAEDLNGANPTPAVELPMALNNLINLSSDFEVGARTVLTIAGVTEDGDINMSIPDVDACTTTTSSRSTSFTLTLTTTYTSSSSSRSSTISTSTSTSASTSANTPSSTSTSTKTTSSSFTASSTQTSSSTSPSTVTVTTSASTTTSSSTATLSFTATSTKTSISSTSSSTQTSSRTSSLTATATASTTSSSTSTSTQTFSASSTSSSTRSFSSTSSTLTATTISSSTTTSFTPTSTGTSSTSSTSISTLSSSSTSPSTVTVTTSASTTTSSSTNSMSSTSTSTTTATTSSMSSTSSSTRSSSGTSSSTSTSTTVSSTSTSTKTSSSSSSSSFSSTQTSSSTYSSTVTATSTSTSTVTSSSSLSTTTSTSLTSSFTFTQSFSSTVTPTTSVSTTTGSSTATKVPSTSSQTSSSSFVSFAQLQARAVPSILGGFGAGLLCSALVVYTCWTYGRSSNSQVAPEFTEIQPDCSSSPRSKVHIVIDEAAELAEQLARTLREAQHEAHASGDLASGELFVELMENLERIFRGHQRSFSQDVEKLCRSWRARNLSARGFPPNSLEASLVRDLADTVQSLVQQRSDMPLSRYSFTVLCQEILETWQKRFLAEDAAADRSEAAAAADHGDSKSKASSCLQSDACIDLLVALEELVWQNSRGEEFRNEVARVCRSWKDRHRGESLPDNAGVVLLLKSLSDLLRAAVSSDGGKVQRGRRACSNLLNALKKLFSDGRQRPGGSLANEISHVCRTWQTGECMSATSESAVLVTDMADVLQAEALREASNTLAAMSYGTEEILPPKKVVVAWPA